MTRLILVRHGVSLWNQRGRLQGQADSALAPEGERQARALGRHFADLAVDRFEASDLTRARRTAELMGRGTPVLDPLWREIDVGRWRGKAVADLLARRQEAYLAWRGGRHTPPGGEPWEAFRDRVAEALAAVARVSGTALVVTHGGVIRAALALTVGLAPDELAPSRHASYTILELGRSPRLVAHDVVPGEMSAGDARRGCRR